MRVSCQSDVLHMFDKQSQGFFCLCLGMARHIIEVIFLFTGLLIDDMSY